MFPGEELSQRIETGHNTAGMQSTVGGSFLAHYRRRDGQLGDDKKKKKGKVPPKKINQF